MEKKQIIQEMCSRLEYHLNIQSTQKRTVEFFSGLKPSQYFLPHMSIGREIPTRTAWFVEIFVDGMCIFRESYVPSKGDSLEIIESKLIDVLLQQVFNFGVTSAEKLIKKYSNQ